MIGGKYHNLMYNETRIPSGVIIRRTQQVEITKEGWEKNTSSKLKSE